jgi:hypothetical protein
MKSIELDELGEVLANQIIKQERHRILQSLQKLEDQSNSTRTPLYQDTLLKKIREIVNANSR